jgi:hypothetical protein
MESVKPAGIGNELAVFGFEHLPDRLLGQLRMAMRLCFLSFECANYRGDGPETTGEVLEISEKFTWSPGRMRLPDLPPDLVII